MNTVVHKQLIARTANWFKTTGLFSATGFKRTIHPKILLQSLSIHPGASGYQSEVHKRFTQPKD